MTRENFNYCDEVTVAEEKKASHVDRHSDKEMSIRTINNAVIYPYSPETEEFEGEVFVNNVRVSEVNSATIYTNTVIIESLPAIDDYVDEAIYLGSQNMCWGHYITDGISKMWCLQSPEFQQLIKKQIPVYFSSDWMLAEQTPNSWKHLIDLLGGEDLSIIPLKHSTRFGKLHIPTNCFFNTDNGRMFTDEYVRLINVLRNKALALHKKWGTFDKLYLTRTKLPFDHGEFGERSIERIFRKNGFHVISPEQLSFEQQIWLLWNAKEVAGTMGSISHNFVFCKPDTKVTIIRKIFYTNDFQYALNQVAQLDVSYIDAHLSVFVTSNVVDGPFFIYPNSNVIRYFSDTYQHKPKQRFSKRLFKKYVMMCLRRPSFDGRVHAPEYYYQMMFEELNSHRDGTQSLYHRMLKIPRFAFLRRAVKRITR